MTSETKIEAVIFTALAMAGVFLWWHNHRSGAGTGLESVPLLSGAAQSVASALPSLPATVPGASFNFTPAVSNAAGSCNCPAGSPQTIFGSVNDMIAYLLAHPALIGTPGAGITSLSTY